MGYKDKQSTMNKGIMLQLETLSEGFQSSSENLKVPSCNSCSLCIFPVLMLSGEPDVAGECKSQRR